ncbi:MAG: SagB/ThcOx family dehydrogenase [Candidatus Bipolaricaulota bacterium]|nr:SagB/ThcOx family dehydrogenase [Candidatus Bipolaricaulota bacterium]
MDPIENGRRLLKATAWARAHEIETDQKRGLPHPPLQKPAPEGVPLIDLPDPKTIQVSPVSVADAIGRRRSHRRFAPDPLSLEELTFLLWATQGVQRVVRDGVASLRTVPSAGARHPFETSLIVNRVTGLEPGLYRYLALDHALAFLRADQGLPAQVVEGCLGQEFVGQGAVVFAWTVVPYRTEWRYSTFSHKVIAIDAGHVCQNLYLACEAIGAGTCGVGAYHQEKMDALLGVDGEDEFTIYVAPVGRVK